MYGVVEYGEMLADAGRMAAYARAIAARVAPGSVVLDIGTGPGIFALLACRAGAARVYAVEPDDVIQIAREAAAANGVADRIQFLRADAGDIDLPARVDGIVADLRGTLPMFRASLATIADARRRFLAPGGWTIAERDTLWAALVSSPDLYERVAGGWRDALGLDFSAARTRAVNNWRPSPIGANDLASEPRRWATIDYLTIDDASVSGEAAWTVARAAEVHGVACWFDTETAPGLCLSNSPLAAGRHCYGRALFPWPQPTSLDAGDQVRVRFRADFVGGDYTWTWDTAIADGGGAAKASYRQSTFLGAPLSTERLRRRADVFVPRPGEDARIDRRILELMDEGLTVGEIADRIGAAFPHRFTDRGAALTRVGDCSDRYADRG